MARTKWKVSKTAKSKVVVYRSAAGGKVEQVEVDSADLLARTRFLRAASLKAEPKKARLSEAKARAAVQKYFREHSGTAVNA